MDRVDHLEGPHFLELAELESWYWWHQVRFRWIWRKISQEGIESLVDIGCGTGGLLDFLRHRGFGRIHGFEGSPTAMKILERKGIPFTTWSWGEPAIQDHSERYGAVALLDVLEHVDDDDGLLRLATTLLTDNGRIAITVPADPRLMSLWDLKLNHKRRYTRADLLDLCDRSKLEILHLECAFRWAWIPGWFRTKSSELGDSFPQLGRFANRLLLVLSEIEMAAFRGAHFGSGTSYFLIARKRGKG